MFLLSSSVYIFIFFLNLSQVFLVDSCWFSATLPSLTWSTLDLATHSLRLSLKLALLVPICYPEQNPMVSYQVRPWVVRYLLSWRPQLGFCYLPYFSQNLKLPSLLVFTAKAVFDSHNLDWFFTVVGPTKYYTEWMINHLSQDMLEISWTSCAQPFFASSRHSDEVPHESHSAIVRLLLVIWSTLLLLNQVFFRKCLRHPNWSVFWPYTQVLSQLVTTTLWR